MRKLASGFWMSERAGQFVFTAVITILLFAMAMQSIGFSVRARYFPLTLGIIGTLAGLMSLALQMRSYRLQRGEPERIAPLPEAAPAGESSGEILSHIPLTEAEPFRAPPIREVAAHFMLFLAYLAGIGIVGMHVASFVMIFCTQYFMAKIGVVKSLLAAIACIVILLLLGRYMNIRWPTSLMSGYYKYLSLLKL
jgi:hypothetical protein